MGMDRMKTLHYRHQNQKLPNSALMLQPQDKVNMPLVFLPAVRDITQCSSISKRLYFIVLVLLQNVMLPRQVEPLLDNEGSYSVCNLGHKLAGIVTKATQNKAR